MPFKYQIGDHVMSTLLLEENCMMMKQSDTITPRLGMLRVEERLSVECVGGTQLFYSCRNADGTQLKFNEDGLTAGDAGFGRWVEAFMTQQDRSKAKKDRPL